MYSYIKITLPLSILFYKLLVPKFFSYGNVKLLNFFFRSMFLIFQKLPSSLSSIIRPHNMRIKPLSAISFKSLHKMSIFQWMPFIINKYKIIFLQFFKFFFKPVQITRRKFFYNIHWHSFLSNIIKFNIFSFNRNIFFLQSSKPFMPICLIINFISNPHISFEQSVHWKSNLVILISQAFQNSL